MAKKSQTCENSQKIINLIHFAILRKKRKEQLPTTLN